jgi:hypothetical protein
VDLKLKEQEMAMTVGRITIDNGSVQVAGKEVGRCDHGYKFGYHPAILLEIGSEREWFELDTPDLMEKIFTKADEFIEWDEMEPLIP